MTSFSFAVARGTNPDMGAEIVICSGVGMTTITIGPDGQPIEKTHLCPDGASTFAADFVLPVLVAPQPVLIAVIAMVPGTAPDAQQELSPSARGPPAQV